MRIYFIGKVDASLKKSMRLAANLALDSLGQQKTGLELNISFISDEEMAALNSRTRGIDRVTDVLSYPNFSLKPFERLDLATAERYDGAHILLGDMAICLAQAQRQAKEHGKSLESELVKLVIHSVLHMMGFDHIKDEDYRVMSRQEKKIASVFKEKTKIR